MKTDSKVETHLDDLLELLHIPPANDREHVRRLVHHPRDRDRAERRPAPELGRDRLERSADRLLRLGLRLAVAERAARLDLRLGLVLALSIDGGC